MRKFGITLWFYFKENFTKKNMMILGAFTVGIVVIAFVISLFGARYNDVAIVNNSQSFALTGEHFTYLEGWNVHFPASEQLARTMLDDGYVDEIFVIEGTIRPSFRIIAPNETSSAQTEVFINHILTMKHLESVIARYELPPGAVAEITTPVEASFESLLDMEDAVAAVIIGTIVSFAMYMLVLISGQGIASSIVAEKSSKVMELMMGKVHPTITMLAKVLSFFSELILLAVAIGLGVFIANLLDLINIGEIMSMLGEIVSMELIVFSIIIVLLGYFMYVFIFAALGAIATSVESLNTMMAPITIALVIPFFASMWLDLGSRIMNIAVYIPIFSPFIIMQRYIRGYSSIMEMGIVIATLAVCMVVTLFVAARINKNGIMHTKESFSFKDFKKLMQK
ncbi:MAG: ABC transporter permease [Defluviitaleaceae bacterium]|nr:ABC transporter permease [Defluviitaleaceae bacterium]